MFWTTKNKSANRCDKIRQYLELFKCVNHPELSQYISLQIIQEYRTVDFTVKIKRLDL